MIRVRPFAAEAEAQMSWRLRRMSGTTCPHWAAVAHRRRDSAARWAARLAAVALGECRGPCQHGALVRALSRKLRPHRRLTPALHAAVCAAACAHGEGGEGGEGRGTPSSSAAAAANASASTPRAVAGGRRATLLLPGCLCDATPLPPDRDLGAGVRPDCGCRVGGGPGPHYSLDATPMLHRLPAIWRMQARLPRLAALKFVVLLRRPEERAASHFKMLVKLASRGEEWAQVYDG